MRQKYKISLNNSGNELKIREYAVIEKDLEKVTFEHLRKDNFSLVCEETYKSEFVVDAIPKGMSSLIDILRTNNIFPINPYATKIAETVIDLYSFSEDRTVEIFFDDVDLVGMESTA